MVLWVSLLFVLVATGYDLKFREVPDAIPIALLAWAIVATALHLHAVTWTSLVLGFALALGLGVVVFAIGGLGGGDVKMVAALGALLGPAALMFALFFVSVAGGFFSVIALIRRKKDFAYLPAIALGLFIYILWRDYRLHAMHAS